MRTRRSILGTLLAAPLAWLGVNREREFIFVRHDHDKPLQVSELWPNAFIRGGIGSYKYLTCCLLVSREEVEVNGVSIERLVDAKLANVRESILYHLKEQWPV